MFVQKKVEREASPLNELDDFFKGTFDFFKWMFGMNNSEEETKEEDENKAEKEEQWKDTNESQVEDDVSVADSVETKQDNNSPWIDQWDIEIHKV